MRPHQNPFTMLELVCATIILGLILATFMGLVQSLQKAQTLFIRESHANLVLENVIERAIATKPLQEEDLRRYLEEEFTKADIPNRHELAVETQARDAHLRLRIFESQRNRTLAEVEVPYEK